MACDRYNCYFSFWAISLPFYPPKSPKIKFLKKWKNTWRYHHFTLVYQKLWLDDLWFLRCDVRHMNGQTDGQKKLDRKIGRANATKERRWIFSEKQFFSRYLTIWYLSTSKTREISIKITFKNNKFTRWRTLIVPEHKTLKIYINLTTEVKFILKLYLALL